MTIFLLFLSDFSAWAWRGVRFDELVLVAFSTSVLCDFFKSFSNSVIFSSISVGAGGGFQFLFLM